MARLTAGSPAAALAAALLLMAGAMAFAPSAWAQAARNGPEWDGKDHQPTQAGVVRREDQAGVRPPPAVVQQDKRTVEQIDKQLLHEEAVKPP